MKRIQLRRVKCDGSEYLDLTVTFDHGKGKIKNWQIHNRCKPSMVFGKYVVLDIYKIIIYIKF